MPYNCNENNGWMKNPKTAMISCNDGFRPVGFYIETLEGNSDTDKYFNMIKKVHRNSVNLFIYVLICKRGIHFPQSAVIPRI